ncbi:MAG: hypothetical protein HC837_14510 [Chloroflexaceae bacterium]|nr:hypothetical protein [Chloroflexaceae bacterium]
MTDPGESEQSENSIFAKLKQRRQEITEEPVEEPFVETTIDIGDEALQFFSDDDISLHEEDDHDASEHASADTTLFKLLPHETDRESKEEESVTEPERPSGMAMDVPAEDVPDMTPFSLDELDLSSAAVAAMGVGMGEQAAPAETEVPAETEPEMTPFSLEELGLSPEEIAAMGMGEQAAPPKLKCQPKQSQN